MIIYTVSNEYLEMDKVPTVEVEGVKFVEIDPFDLVESNEDLIILDRAMNVEHVTVIRDLNKLKDSYPISGHDIDMSLLLKLRDNTNVTFIAVPMINFVKQELIDVIQKLRQESALNN